MSNLPKDQNSVNAQGGVSDLDGSTILPFKINHTTGRLMLSSTIAGGGVIASINADATSAQVLAVGTSGTDFAIVDNGTGTHTFNLPTASASNRGALSSADWTTFNGKQASGTYVTAISIASANGISGSSSGGATPALTLTLGAITPTSVNGVTLSGSSTPTLAVTGTTAVSGSNTGDQTISDATISTTDIVTNNSSTSKHGFLSKLDNNAGHYMDGTGNWTAPTGSGVTPLTTGFSISAGTTPKTLINQVNTTFTGGDMTFTGSGSNTYTFPSTTDTLAGLGTAQTFTATQTQKCIIDTNNAITASGNAASVPITYRLNTVTNNSAATLTITMTTTSAVDGQMTIVRILDSSAVAQTVAWVNTENSTVSAPTTSNGSTTLFLTVGFIYNAGTSKWRCVASA